MKVTRSCRWICRFGALLCVVSLVFGVEQKTRRYTATNDVPFWMPPFANGDLPPHLRGGVIIGVEHARSATPQIRTTNRDGTTDRFYFAIPGASFINIDDIARTEDGTMAVVGYAVSDPGQAATFLAVITADKKLKTLVQLPPYFPHVVTITPDHVIWTIGWIRVGDRVLQYNLLKRFDLSGNVLSSEPIGVRPRPKSPAHSDVSAASCLAASPDRVGWLTTAGEYLEFALDGHEITRIDTPEREHFVGVAVASLSISSNNDAIISYWNGKTVQLWSLDREARTWISADLGRGSSAWYHPLGFDGETLVLQSSNSDVYRYHGVPVEPAQ